MQKEEIFAVLDRLIIDQDKYNKFSEYVNTFTNEPRCKKGCLAFIEEVFNLPQIAGRNQLAIQLVSSKTMKNADDTRFFINNHQITTGYEKALQEARNSLLKLMGDYALDTSRRLDETTLMDKSERQVFLRRAIARLMTVFDSRQQVAIKTEQWSEIEPYTWIDYLSTDLESLIASFCSGDMATVNFIYSCSLDSDRNLESMRSFVEYLDTFTEF